jgi:hypothetical protein
MENRVLQLASLALEVQPAANDDYLQFHFILVTCADSLA